MNNILLSKSDFKIDSSCIKKLHYKKLHYSTNNDDNEYMQMLAEGGYIVGKMATLKYPDGIDLSEEKDAITKTKELLSNENITLFEAAISSNNKLIRIDILEKKGNVFNLIEVKAKSFDSFDENTDKKLKEYIEDVAYQTMVLQEVYPDYIINSFLYMPDKAQVTDIEGLAGWFKKENDNSNPNFRKVKVDFIHPINSIKHKQLIADPILQLKPLNDEVNKMLPEIKKKINIFLKHLSEDFKNLELDLNKDCFKCEYNCDNNGHNGYKECWGKLAEPNPHVSEMYYVGTIGGSKEPIVNSLIKDGKTSMYDICESDLKKSDGTVGSRNERQLIQLLNTKNKTEWFSENLKSELNQWQYPLYFIDFETSTNAIPFHADMRPYEMIAFQWSCHIVESPDAQPKHLEWINMDYDFPNFKFAESLMEAIGYNGTPLMWATHENTTLRAIYNQMEERNYKNNKLKEWLENIVKMDDKDEGRFIDMNALTLKHYFHPDMKGKTSIKKTLPAIWNNNSYLHKIPWFAQYYKEEYGEILSPYKALKDQIEIYEQTEVVNDGTGAMRAYFEIMFGDFKDNQKIRENWRDLLLQYCELDTMAMVIIWTHWIKLTNKK